MILNLSSDIPFVYKNDSIIFFERKELETKLPKFLKKNGNLDKIYVITGPGNFSSTRIGVEVINILIFLGVFKEIYFLDKLDFFNKLGYKNIYLFSGNKNKLIFLKESKEFEIVNKIDFKDFKIEETFEIEYGKEKILYKDLFEKVYNLKWNKLEKGQLLSPYYIFQPMVN